MGPGTTANQLKAAAGSNKATIPSPQKAQHRHTRDLHVHDSVLAICWVKVTVLCMGSGVRTKPGAYV